MGCWKSASRLVTLAAAAMLGAAAQRVSADSFGDAMHDAVPARAVHLSTAALLVSARSTTPQRRLVLEPRLASFALRPSDVHVADAGDATRFGVAFPIKWQKEPQIVTAARKFRRQGLPLVHLWQSDSGEHVLAIGLNPHGVPGIWFTQKVPD
jgi:hypothetical protein